MLKLKREPAATREIEVMDGVVLTVRPIDSAIEAVARATARRAATDLIAARANVEAAGGRVVGLGLTEPDEIAGQVEVAHAVALAQQVIVDWSGIGDADGRPLAATRDTIEAIVRQEPAFLDAFLTVYSREMIDRAAEGNASGASPNGTSATAPATADGAPISANPAPTAD